MADFINGMYRVLTVDRNTTNGTACTPSVDHYKFYQFALIPAVILTLSFAMSKKRRNILKHVLRGRPALIYPMDLLARTNRLCFGCAFGATAFLVYNIIFNNQYAIESGGNRAVRSFMGIASMFIYGLVYFPVLSSLSVGTVFSLAMGTLYVWTLTIIENIKLGSCQLSWDLSILMVLGALPGELCLIFLCVAMPVRMVDAFKKGNYFFWDGDYTETLQDIRQSYAGHHVISLLRKPVVKLKSQTGIKALLLSTVNGLISRFVYQNKRGFRYPARMVTVAFVSSSVIYMMTFQMLLMMPKSLDNHLKTLDRTRSALMSNNTAQVSYKNTFDIVYTFLEILKYTLIVTSAMSAVFAIFNVLNTMSSYRANLHALYRGDHSTIPEWSSNVSNCASSIRYAGYQVGYIIWAYFIHLFVLILLSYLIAIFILLIKTDFSRLMIWCLNLVWPVLVTVILVSMGTLLLAKFFFLQERGRYLALDNRSFYFNFTYFMFFYNIFLGMVMCLVRILKAVFLGLVFLGRLDNSTLARRFEFLDPGFKAYVGYMHMEAAHTHPVMIIFCRLMLLSLQDKLDRLVSQDTTGGLDNCSRSSICINMEREDEKESETERRRKMAARFKWHVAYTLLLNPDIRCMRRGCIHLLRAKTLGVIIPVSDSQAVNVEELEKDVAEAKDRGRRGGNVEAL